jgi:hypothetical protein
MKNKKLNPLTFDKFIFKLKEKIKNSWVDSLGNVRFFCKKNKKRVKAKMAHYLGTKHPNGYR